MAGDDTDKKGPSIPAWQFPAAPSPESETNKSTITTSALPELDTLEHARRFLDDDSIKNASRERKVECLETKGLKPEEIEDLLSSQQDTKDTTSQSDLKTIHDSTTTLSPNTHPSKSQAQTPLQDPPSSEPRITTPRSDIAPIITYPEFLLKPVKPPPLVTFDRLASAAYVLAGLSALTYGASKYLVQPMLESLTDARQSLATTTTSSLTTFNTRLEESVSHVPYIPPLYSSKNNNTTTATNDLDDTDSTVSDPTELFHRDIATQTTPDSSPSRTLSLTDPQNTTKATLSPTETQSTQLKSLHTTLQSLLSSQKIHFAEDNLSSSLSGFQVMIDKLQNPDDELLDYTNTSSTYPWQNTPQAKSSSKPGVGAGASGSKTNEVTNQALKFKSEIRALKGAFLSSRNFPTARGAVPFSLSQQR